LITRSRRHDPVTEGQVRNGATLRKNRCSNRHRPCSERQSFLRAMSTVPSVPTQSYSATLGVAVPTSTKFFQDGRNGWNAWIAQGNRWIGGNGNRKGRNYCQTHYPRRHRNPVAPCAILKNAPFAACLPEQGTGLTLPLSDQTHRRGNSDRPGAGRKRLESTWTYGMHVTLISHTGHAQGDMDSGRPVSCCSRW
jgi:hypothetical protein